MTGYVKTIWEDQIIERPKTYTMNANTDGTTTLVDAFGVITNPGTSVDAAALNNMEDGIENAVTVTDEQSISGEKTFLQNVILANELPGTQAQCTDCYKGDSLDAEKTYWASNVIDADGNAMASIEASVSLSNENQISVRLWPYSSTSTAYVDALTIHITEDGKSSVTTTTSPAANDFSTTLATTEWAVGKDSDNTLTGDNTFQGLNTFENVTTFTEVIQGTAVSAYFGDLAEYYETDAEYPKGTLVQFGGANEITVATTECNAVITSEPGFILNGKKAENNQAIALIGRVLVRVVGKVDKFENVMLSDTPGIACRAEQGRVVGKALEAKSTDEEGLVECVVKLAF